MSVSTPQSQLADRNLAKLKQSCRVLLLLDAAERAGIAPLLSARLHAFAYFADVLSPVWGLVPFDGKIYKSEGGPHYPDLQDTLDYLVVLGLIQVGDLRYVPISEKGARVVGAYALNFESEHLEPIFSALGARGPEQAIDPNDHNLHEFLVELAGALATLPDDQIEFAAGVDVTYQTEKELHNIVDFAEWVEDRKAANPSWRAAERFRTFLPQEARLLPGEKLYLYAAYLGRAINVD